MLVTQVIDRTYIEDVKQWKYIQAQDTLVSADMTNKFGDLLGKCFANSLCTTAVLGISRSVDTELTDIYEVFVLQNSIAFSNVVVSGSHVLPSCAEMVFIVLQIKLWYLTMAI